MEQQGHLAGDGQQRSHYPVVIAGGGPVGLALAIDLGVRGTSCLLLEARNGVIAVPKMTSVLARSMEFCRQWGIAQDVERVAWPAEHPHDYVHVTSMTGHELARSRWGPYGAREYSNITPHGALHCPQIYFDPVLRQRAAELPGVTLRHLTSLESFREEGDRVQVRLRDIASGQVADVTASYLVGCDGADSFVRETLGIRFLGEGKLSHSLSIFFRSAELAQCHDKGWARFYRLIDEGGHWADLVSINGADLWRLTVFDMTADGANASDDASPILYRAVGRPIAFELLSVLPWQRRDQIAEHYGRGRVFIAGDAAHVLSPTGGLGMNTGIADAADLGWKIAAMLDGWGGPRLLDSYEAERKPVAQRYVDESTAYFRRIQISPRGRPYSAATPEGAETRKTYAADFSRLEREGALYVSEMIKMGLGYEDSPICVADGSPPPHYAPTDYVPLVRPGWRAPHFWLPDGRSILDLFGKGFVLLRFGALPVPADLLLTTARRMSLPLAVFDISDPVAVALYKNLLVLVRPDGHVAWCGDILPQDLISLLDRVRGSEQARSFR